MSTLRPDETELVGKWELVGGRLVADAVATRIQMLLSGPLIPIRASQDGWNTLYLDPSDNRLWELSYPESHLHGGGPPSLTLLSSEEADKRYGYRLA